MDDTNCYVCRRDMNGETETIEIKYYLEALSGHSQRVPCHRACKKGSSAIVTEQGLMWERS